MIFKNRVEAGLQLASALMPYVGGSLVVLGLPRGGVPVAREVAAVLHAPLDVLVVRKIGLPFQPEVAMGAVGEGGVGIRNRDTMRLASVSDEQFLAIELHELGEVERRCRRYRGTRPMAELTGKVAIIVDDGVATGATASAAISVARAHGAAFVVMATPVSSAQAAHDLAEQADDFVAIQTPADMLAVGYWYDDFTPTTDDEVERILAEAHAARL